MMLQPLNIQILNTKVWLIFPLQMGDFQFLDVNFPGCMFDVFDVFVKGKIGIFHGHELKYRRGGWILIYWILLVSLIGAVGCLACFSRCD